jgi:hypothetical protein
MIMRISLEEMLEGSGRGRKEGAGSVFSRREFNPARQDGLPLDHMHMSIDDLIISGFIDMVPPLCFPPRRRTCA